MRHARRESIKEILNSSGYVVAQELSIKFNVSSETIRRDLERLEQEGDAQRVHGGAISIRRYMNESAYQSREKEHAIEKHAIAEAAAKMVCEGDTVLIAPGTTTLEVASLLHDKNNVTVITNSLPIAMELANTPNINVFCLGGQVQGDDYSASGVMAVQNLEIFNVNKLILSIGGITPDKGLTDYRVNESAMIRYFIERVDCIIGVADHSKFGIVSRYIICPASRLDHLITDSGTPEIVYRPYQEAGVQVHVVHCDAIR